MRREEGGERFLELISRIQSGDMRAEDELFEAFQVVERVQMMINTRIHATVEDKNDLIGEVLQALLIGLRNGRFQPNRGPFGSYLWGISRNKIRDYLRRRKNRQFSTILEEPIGKMKTDANLFQVEQDNTIQRKINRLEDKYRQVILMKYFEELPVKEIAVRLNLIPKQVYNRLNYSIKLLRNAY
ncbi:MAG: RNA polymerase sigma factor [Calditrichia bacterium]